MNCDHCGDEGEPRQVKIAGNAPTEYHILCDLCFRLWEHANATLPVKLSHQDKQLNE